MPKQVSYLPFVTRHGKSDCDRHFEKVKDYTTHFENTERVIGHKNVKHALLHSQKRETNKGSSEIRVKDGECFNSFKF